MKSVVLVVFTVAVGVLVGYVCHGRLRRLAQPPPARNRLLLTALGLYVIAVFAGLASDSALGIISALAWFTVAFYVWLNRWMPGARLIALGLAANALALLLNGAIPTVPSAADRAGATLSAEEHAVADGSHLDWLGKSIPVAFPPRPEVVSPGDIAIAAGIAVVLATGMTGRRPASNELPQPSRRYRFAEQYARQDATDELAPKDSAPPGPSDADSSHATSAHATMDRRTDGDTSPIRGSAGV